MSRKKIYIISSLLAGILLVALIVGFWPIPDIESGFDYAVVVHFSDSEKLAEFYRERRFFVPYKDIPDHVGKAFVAAEDRRFYSHHGFDIIGITRALHRNIAANEIMEGGSTITQQLAKMILKNSERNFSRKLQEMIIALRLESKYSKEEILGLYMNLAYFGERVYGIEAAARAYFNKSVTDLSVAEAALLAGLQKAPNKYSPLKNPELAQERMTKVLGEMLALKFISHEEYLRALAEPLPDKTYFQRKYDAPYFADYIRQKLCAKYGDALYRTGYHVFSTLDPSLQSAAERSVLDGVHKIDRGSRRGVQAALIAIDMATGEIKAMVGGTDYSVSQFNRATMALRQPGSVFKPFVYAVALQEGMSSDDLILDEPVHIQDPDTGRPWSPRNSEDKYYGYVPLKTALALSLNSATVRLAQKIGIDNVREMAERCGIRTNRKTHLSMALGSFETTLLDMTIAYTAFATGKKVEPLAYTLIRDKNGKEVERPLPSSRVILPPDIVEKMRMILRGPIEHGIAGRARAVGRRVYGKTGTTNDYSDAWFVGFDEHIAVGVWVGRDDHTTLGIEQTGSEAALPIWTEFMKKVKYKG